MRTAALAGLLVAGCAVAQAPPARQPFLLDAGTTAWRWTVDRGGRDVTLAVERVRRPPVGLQTLRFSLACGNATLWTHDVALHPPDAPLRFVRPLWPAGGVPPGCAPELRLGFGGDEGEGWPALEGEVQVTR